MTYMPFIFRYEIMYWYIGRREVYFCVLMYITYIIILVQCPSIVYLKFYYYQRIYNIWMNYDLIPDSPSVGARS